MIDTSICVVCSGGPANGCACSCSDGPTYAEVPGSSLNPANVGRKDDQGKDRWDLVPWAAVTQVVKVLTFGANHYGDDNWRRVEGWRKRYFAAACRHLTRWVLGERTDPATGLHHLAHAACCVLFLLELDV